MKRKRPCKEVLVRSALLFDRVKSYLFSKVLRCWVKCTHFGSSLLKLDYKLSKLPVRKCVSFNTCIKTKSRNYNLYWKSGKIKKH